MSGPDLLGALAVGLDPARARAADDAAVTGDGRVRCSRRGCTAAATWALEWNNPRIHTPDRRKTWVACEPHREVLADFLASRGLLRTVRALAAVDPSTAATTDPEDPA